MQTRRSARRTSRVSALLSCPRRAVVLHCRRAGPRGGIPVPGCASGITDAPRRACRTVVCARGRDVRVSGPVQRLNRVSSRRLNRFIGRNGALVRHRPRLPSTCALSERSHATRGIFASPTCGRGTTCSRFSGLLSAASGALHPIPSEGIFGCRLQGSLRDCRSSAASLTNWRFTEQYHVRSRLQ